MYILALILPRETADTTWPSCCPNDQSSPCLLLLRPRSGPSSGSVWDPQSVTTWGNCLEWVSPYPSGGCH